MKEEDRKDRPRGRSTAPQPLAEGDYYFDGPFMVFTQAYHLQRGYCCGSGCRHCPYKTAKPDKPKG